MCTAARFHWQVMVQWGMFSIMKDLQALPFLWSDPWSGVCQGHLGFCYGHGRVIWYVCSSDIDCGPSGEHVGALVKHLVTVWWICDSKA